MARQSKRAKGRNPQAATPVPQAPALAAGAPNRELKIGLSLDIILALVPFGYQLLGLPNAPVVGVICWAVCLVVLGRIIWGFAHRLSLSIIVPLVLAAALWVPVTRGILSAKMPAAKIEITRILASPAFRTDLKEGFFVNLYYTNRGSVPARGLLDHGMIKLTDRGLSDSELNDIAVDLLNDQHGTPNVRDEVQPGADLWFTDRHPYLTQADISAIAGGTKALYMVHVMRYRDSSMKDTEEGVTEFCQYYSGSFTIAKTCGNNRSYKRTIPQARIL